MTRQAFGIGCLSLGAFLPALGVAAVAREADAQREPLDVPEAALYVSPSLEAAMFDDLNALRRGRKVSPLVLDPALTEVAREYARQMLRGHFIGHIAPDGSTFMKRLTRAGLAALHMGENLAYTTGDESEAFTHLVASRGHLANMLNPLFTKVGVGAISVGLYGTMYVQELEGD